MANVHVVQVTASHGVAISPDGRAICLPVPGTPAVPIEPTDLVAAVLARREVFLREVAVLTAWLEAVERAAESCIVAPPPGMRIVPPNGNGNR